MSEMYDYTYEVRDAPSRAGSTTAVTVRVRAANDYDAENAVLRATGDGYEYMRQVDVRKAARGSIKHAHA